MALYMRNMMIVIVACAALSLGACSTTAHYSTQHDTEIHDPFEDTNRAIFAFNNVFNDTLIHPVAKGYKAAVPEPVRNGVSNFLQNLKSPLNFMNQLLQGDLRGAGKVLTRVIVNSLIGVGGIIDIAGHEGIEHETEDFGQTLATWGVGHGPYIVLPIIGPSTMRDYAGFAVDAFADPLRFYAYNTDNDGLYYTKIGVDYLDLRISLVDVLEDLKANSIDYYAAVRSIYFQRRAAMVRDEKGSDRTESFDIPDYDDDL